MIYSFADLTAVIKHDAVGQLTLQGTGVGEIAFNMANDVSAHDLAADGTVMVSKIKAGNGTVVITVQQTSEANKWFTKLYNYLEAASSSEWAGTSLLATSNVMEVTHECNQMSFQKRPDRSYQQQGQQVTWTFMAAEMKEY